MIDPSLSTSKPIVHKAECSKCGGVRNCDIRGKHTKSYDDEHFWSQTVWYILECRGCENVFVKTVDTNSEEYDQAYSADGSGEVITTMVETIQYWPALSQRKEPEWMSEYGVDAENMRVLHAPLRELYGALNNDLRMLEGVMHFA